MRLTIGSIITVVIGLLVFFAVWPMLIENISTGANASTLGLTGLPATIIEYLPLVAVVGVIVMLLGAFSGGSD